MGKTLPSAIKLQDFTIIPSKQIESLKPQIPRSKNQLFPDFVKSEASSSDRRAMEESSERRVRRTPLSAVVSDCSKRWFQDTLKEARAGDPSMQVLVGQMYYSGYGIPKDENKGKAWIAKASKRRSSVWKVGDKHPGYNASDSDSDELKSDSKEGQS